jgi:membrane protease subunit (stomatin/prohibitin family)
VTEAPASEPAAGKAQAQAAEAKEAEEPMPDVGETLACPGCGKDISEKDMIFCPDCGTKVRE